MANYQAALDALIAAEPDLVFVFHSFRAWPTQVRHMLLELGRSTPIVGYTHGSHWDPSDYVRTQFYPGLEMADLANLVAMDRVLLVSEYMRETLHRNISELNPRLAEDLVGRAAVVGLPINAALIDQARTDRKPDIPTIVFNHAPVASKNPQLFTRVMAWILPDCEVTVLFTRGFDPTEPEGAAVQELHDAFPEQVVLGNNMDLPDYYQALWAGEIQVSTADHESLGISTLEAMYTETCCILPSLGSYPEITGNNAEVLYPLGEGPLEERIRWFLDHRHRPCTDLPESSSCGPGSQPVRVPGANSVECLQGFAQRHAQGSVLGGLDVDVGAERHRVVRIVSPVLHDTGQGRPTRLRFPRVPVLGRVPSNSP